MTAADAEGRKRRASATEVHVLGEQLWLIESHVVLERPVLALVAVEPTGSSTRSSTTSRPTVAISAHAAGPHTRAHELRRRLKALIDRVDGGIWTRQSSPMTVVMLRLGVPLYVPGGDWSPVEPADEDPARCSGGMAAFAPASRAG